MRSSSRRRAAQVLIAGLVLLWGGTVRGDECSQARGKLEEAEARLKRCQQQDSCDSATASRLYQAKLAASNRYMGLMSTGGCRSGGTSGGPQPGQPSRPDPIDGDANLSPQVADGDGDGVADISDNCPTTPPALRDAVDANGCPVMTLEVKTDKTEEYACHETVIISGRVQGSRPGLPPLHAGSGDPSVQITIEIEPSSRRWSGFRAGTTTKADGSFLVEFPVPAGLPAGNHTIQAMAQQVSYPRQTASTVFRSLHHPVIQKLIDGKNLDSKEFVTYLELLEENNPEFTWKQQIAQLHYAIYQGDLYYEELGVKLFLQGEETEGYKKVRLFGNTPAPNYMTNERGRLIKISHAYAGLRSALNRSEATEYPMLWANTHAGDYIQVGGHTIMGTAELGQVWLEKAFGADVNALLDPTSGDPEKVMKSWEKSWEKRWKMGMDEIKNAPNYASTPELRGNEIGFYLNEYYSHEGNADKPLSEAFKESMRLYEKDVIMRDYKNHEALKRIKEEAFLMEQDPGHALMQGWNEG